MNSFSCLELQESSAAAAKPAATIVTAGATLEIHATQFLAKTLEFSPEATFVSVVLRHLW